MSMRSLLSSFQDVRVIDRNVPCDKEPTKILLEDQRRPVMFNDLNGAKAAGNLWSSRERVAAALGLKKEKLTESLVDAMSSPRKPKEISDPDWRDSISDDFDLMKLPLPKYYPKDGGRYVTAGVAIADYEGKRNISFHRLMLMDSHRFAIRLVPRHLFTMHQMSMRKGKDLKVAFCVGVCPSVLLAGAVSTDYAVDEMEVASAIRYHGLKKDIEVARTDSGLMVPAHSEYVIEGRLTSELVDEGPFVDITGTYDSVRKQPVFEVDRVYRRKDPIFHLVLPGGLEHYLLMGLPREPVIFKTVRQVVPRVHGVRLTEGGCCWLHGVVSITKNKEGDAMNAAMAAFSGHASMKKVTIVDNDVDIFDDQSVEWAEATRFQASRSLLVVNNAAGSSLDPSTDGTTSKVAIDATKPLGVKEGFEKAALE
ncbi:MAG: 3-octaprenyl-4-hydroxybenzoate decarboxylase [Methanomassiliicoccales archaeon PtaU1.Bin124]|nr:MAG: 3-octaprenyl-4-hydroxybenzoate decarboxylase [Methanomassiliicoccales archaeon PtaU1.Bin124]